MLAIGVSRAAETQQCAGWPLRASCPRKAKHEATTHKSLRSRSRLRTVCCQHVICQHVHCVAGQVSDHSPWFDAYKREFLRTLRFGELETLDHPVACEAVRLSLGRRSRRQAVTPGDQVTTCTAAIDSRTSVAISRSCQ